MDRIVAYLRAHPGRQSVADVVSATGVALRGNRALVAALAKHPGVRVARGTLEFEPPRTPGLASSRPGLLGVFEREPAVAEERALRAYPGAEQDVADLLREGSVVRVGGVLCYQSPDTRPPACPDAIREMWAAAPAPEPRRRAPGATRKKRKKKRRRVAREAQWTTSNPHMVGENEGH